MRVMALSRAVLGWADQVFATYPPIRSGRILSGQNERWDDDEGLHDDTEHCEGSALAPTSAGGMGTHATPPDDMDAVTPGNTSADPSLKEMAIDPW
jgi:hypothetical protein